MTGIQNTKQTQCFPQFRHLLSGPICEAACLLAGHIAPFALMVLEPIFISGQPRQP